MEERATQKYITWWTNDLPPMHGLLRFLFYGGLFALAQLHWKSPLSGIELYQQTDPALFRTYGLMGLLGIPHIGPQVLQVVIAATSVAWVFAAVGFLSRLSAIVTAVGVFFLHGMFFGTNALNHNWFLAMYALIALCFTQTDDRWSVDYWLLRYRGRERPQSRGIGATGFGRKAILVLAVGFYFSAAMTKLQTTGWTWIDGHTISYFAQERGPRHLLGWALTDHAWLCTIAAALTLLVEIASPVALFSKRARIWLIIGWALMHLGIKLTLGPSYWQNMLCFLLLIQWRRNKPPAAPIPNSRSAALLGTSLLALMVAVSAFQIFWWPLTNVYMYSSYYSRPEGIRAGAPEAEYGDEQAVRRIARALTETPTSQDAKEFLAYRPWVRLARDQEFLDLRHGVGVATRKQWSLVVVQPVVIRELASRNGAANEFCQQLVPVIRRRLPHLIWSRFDRVELVYGLEENNIILGAAGLSATPPSRIGTAEERSRLFENLMQWTLEREAFSPPKNRRLGLDFAHDAQELRESFLSASTENDLLLALTRLSNLRRDGHLTVLAEGPGSRESLFLRAPIRFAVDYAEPGKRSLFVRDLGAELKDRVPELGDELISINDNPVAAYFGQMKPYFAASTDNRLWLEFAVNLSTKRHDFDPKLYEEDVTYALRTADGETYTVTVPYLDPTAIRWRGDSVEDVEEIPAENPYVIDWTGWARKKAYPGFRKDLSTESFVVYLPEDSKLGVVLLDWRSFFRETFDSDVDLLMRVAAERGWLDRHVICDLTTTRGGRRSWYLLQKLASKPFRVTYGNLRISDISEEFVRNGLAQYGLRNSFSVI